MNAAARSTKRKRRTLTHRTLRAGTGRLAVTLGAATLNARGRTQALSGAVHGKATLTGDLTVALTGVSATASAGILRARSPEGVVFAFLKRGALVDLFADAVIAVVGSKAAMDNLTARLKALLKAGGPELAPVAQRARVLHAYRSAPPVEKAARRKAGAIALGIMEASFVRAARRSRGGGPGKPGRPRGK